ncbi:Eco57I restriction-modification methylase domain-containing protein [Streptomyces pseudogriseolus]|uniref:Eco57I restriction-modification methylase domain-containing protein n=1 Tax=Streptomyces pseudogriseolus TaxID=36817 RepID=UPI003FA1DF1F
MPTAAAKKKVPPKGKVPTPTEQHEDWLRLLRPDGPFVSLPVLVGAFPQGLDTVPAETWTRLRQAWAEVQEDPALLRHAWEKLVLDELLGWRSPGLRDGSAIPESLRAGANTPDAVLLGPGESGLTPRALLFRTPEWEASLTSPRGEQPSLADRAADLCRARQVPLALLTNGREWALVHARPKEATTVAVFDADLWSEEPLLARAFASLLTARRIVRPPLDAAGKPSDSTAGLFARTAAAQSEVTDTLGRQVREAVSLLVAEVSRLDRESHGAVLRDVPAQQVYEGALTVMMRLVFLLYAEEQRLLPAGDELYDASYAVGPLHEELRTARRLHGGELGDRSAATWPRLLATFAAIHGGCTHDRLWILPYGGSLFDPSRFPWLVDAKVTDRVVYEILDALLTLRARKGFKGEERLSYKGLDVEQIGHVYEGLLEYGCRWADEPYVGVSFGRDKKYEAVLPLARLEEWAEAGTLAEEVAAASGTKPATVTAALTKSGAVTAELETACGSDAALTERAAAFSGLYGIDLRDEPKVWPAGSVVVVRSGNRRDTGTHYTPKALAEEVVEHTLAPLCFAPGPAEGAEPGVWRAKTAEELLKLRVLDPAMGSGAFLVSACRYLSDRVVEAWLRDGLPPEIARDVDEDDREQLHQMARRLVADRCLYGIDRDPMAVELAKLSLWLVTLSKGRPFSFLDHALRCGDSLVGVIDVEQVKAFHLDSGARQLSPEVSRALDVTETLLSKAAELRRKIESTAVTDIRVVRDKVELLEKAESLSGKLRLAADAVVGAALAAEGISDEEASDITGVENVGGARGRAAHAEAKEDAKAKAYRNRLEAVAGLVAAAMGDGAEAEEAAERARGIVEGWLKGPRAEPIRPLHWPLEFPEIMGVGGSSGFDAVVGNPPFVGGQKLTGALGQDYREYLVNRIGGGKRGSADLCSYFLLRNLSLAPGCRTGIIATNTIAQGDTREVGLDQATANGWTVYRAVKSQPWLGTAAVIVSLLWLAGRLGAGEVPILDGNDVRGITPRLDPASRVSGTPYRLVANEAQSFQGSNVLGKGFVLLPEQARALIAKDGKNKEVLFPYLIGRDLNQNPGATASRWVINFHDWPKEKAAEYSDVFSIVERDVKPERARNNNKQRREIWWRFTRPTTELYEAIADMEQAIVIARVSSTGIPIRVPTHQVMSEQVIVFPIEDTAQLAALSSSLHYWWAIKHSGDMRGDLRYASSDVFETFPRPNESSRLQAAGKALESAQRTAMSSREIGLTSVYKLVHLRSETAPDIEAIRKAHIEVDRAVIEAYDWTDLDLKHDFYTTSQDERFTIAPAAQTEVLDRLLELNHARYKEELDKGLHTPEAKKRRAAARKAKAKARTAGRIARQTSEEDFTDNGLFPAPDALF